MLRCGYVSLKFVYLNQISHEVYVLFSNDFLVFGVNSFRVVERSADFFFFISLNLKRLFWFNFVVIVTKYAINVAFSFHVYLVFL
jgi:hypothetical protein